MIWGGASERTDGWSDGRFSSDPGVSADLVEHHVGAVGELLPRRALFAVILTALRLLTLHWREILIWDIAYRLLMPVAPIGTIEAAISFSAAIYTTLGYGDIVLGTEERRLLTGIEALNGILIVGWFTALLFAVVQRNWSSYLRPLERSAELIGGMDLSE